MRQAADVERPSAIAGDEKTPSPSLIRVTSSNSLPALKTTISPFSDTIRI